MRTSRDQNINHRTRHHYGATLVTHAWGRSDAAEWCARQLHEGVFKALMKACVPVWERIAGDRVGRSCGFGHVGS